MQRFSNLFRQANLKYRIYVIYDPLWVELNVTTRKGPDDSFASPHSTEGVRNSWQFVKILQIRKVAQINKINYKQDHLRIFRKLRCNTTNLN